MKTSITNVNLLNAARQFAADRSLGNTQIYSTKLLTTIEVLEQVLTGKGEFGVLVKGTLLERAYVSDCACGDCNCDCACLDSIKLPIKNTVGIT